MPLPDQFQRKLDLPGRSRGCVYQTRRRNPSASGVEDSAVIDGRAEVGMVEQIEQLRPELQIELLRDFVVLERGKIDVPIARPIQRITCVITQEVTACARCLRKGH